MAQEPLRILGVDTSLRSTGVGVVETRAGALRAVHYGILRNPPARLHSACLDAIYAGIRQVIAETRPAEAAIEGIFFCKNVKTAVILGEARGAVLAACGAAGIPVYEYAPRRVKQALVGIGSAQKEQVARMVMSITGLREKPPADAADALAIAICHYHQRRGHPQLGPAQI